MKKEYTLLLTACIDPSVSNYKKHPNFRRDALTRLNDYKTALEYWLSYDNLNLVGIVFVENSGYDLTELEEIVATKNTNNISVEFLRQLAGPTPSGVHYGYSELEMIDFAFDHSDLIKKSNYIIKATGRLYFPKLKNLLNKINSNFKVAIDSRDYKFFKQEKHYLVTTIFMVEKDFYMQVLYDAKSKMTPANGHMEKIYFTILKPLYLPKGDVILRFPFSMNPVGIGAHFNVNYSSSKKIFESRVRDFFRVLLPDFWI